MKCTRMDLDMVTSRVFNGATMSLKRMICSRTPLVPVSLMEENCIMSVLASNFSEVVNLSIKENRVPDTIKKFGHYNNI